MPSPTSTTKECHILPCKIDYSGKVSDYIYFHPQTLEAYQDQNTYNAGDSTGDSASSASFRAAQFRGRGLLSCNVLGASNIGQNDKDKDEDKDKNSKTDDGDADENDNYNDESNKSNAGISDHDNSLQGRLLTVKKSNKKSSSEIQVIGSFDQFTEWYHEHQPEKVLETSTKQRNAKVDITSRAKEWCQIAYTLHRPIPVVEQD